MKLTQELLDVRYCHIRGQAQICFIHELKDPFWQLGSFFISVVSTVGKYHEAIVRLTTNDSSNAVTNKAKD
jgi:hypothetical protein